ncbi:TPA: hypothetical protein ACUNF5_003017 [Burkholderia orbicola]|nr:hypothetical protein [Burkholderia cenocepacia]
MTNGACARFPSASMWSRDDATIAAACAFVRVGYDMPRGVLLARACRHVS